MHNISVKAKNIWDTDRVNVILSTHGYDTMRMVNIYRSELTGDLKTILVGCLVDDNYGKTKIDSIIDILELHNIEATVKIV